MQEYILRVVLSSLKSKRQVRLEDFLHGLALALS
jgi:hypothetical protein